MNAMNWLVVYPEALLLLMACAVALETLRIYTDDNIIGHVQKVAPRLQAGLRQFAEHPLVGEARGIGLTATAMWAHGVLVARWLERASALNPDNSETRY